MRPSGSRHLPVRLSRLLPPSLTLCALLVAGTTYAQGTAPPAGEPAPVEVAPPRAPSPPPPAVTPPAPPAVTPSAPAPGKAEVTPAPAAAGTTGSTAPADAPAIAPIPPPDPSPDDHQVVPIPPPAVESAAPEQAAPIAPPVSAAAAAASPATTAPAATPSEASGGSKLDEMYQEFQALKERLPFRLGAGLWLLYAQPLDGKSTLAGGSTDGIFQLYGLYLTLDKEWKGLGAHTEVRFRDGGHSPGVLNAYQRDFYTSNVWFQEVYAYYRPVSLFNLKAGKLYRRVGAFWDGSFTGNIAYYDGLKLNPDWGIAIEGDKVSESGVIGFRYALQFFVHSDGVSGAYVTGREAPLRMVTPDRLPVEERALYSQNAEAIGSNVRNVVNGRLALSLAPHPKAVFELGGSGLWGQRQFDGVTGSLSFSQLEGDLTMKLGPITLYGEFLRQYGPGARPADYVIGSARLTLAPVTVRVNVSYVHYRMTPTLPMDIEEFIVQPGVTWNIGWGLSLIVEYDEWQRKNPYQDGISSIGEARYRSFDRTLNVVVGYVY